MPLIMTHRWRNVLRSITGVEIQTPLVNLARKNIALNGFDTFIRVISGDVKTLFQHVKRESFSKVICNPPFYQHGEGRTNNNQEALVARHQISVTLEDFVSAAAGAVKNRGSTHFIYPAEKMTDLLILTKRHRLEPKQIMLVYSYPHSNKNAELVLVKCLKNGGSGVKILPPFYVYEEKNGCYSSAMKKYYV